MSWGIEARIQVVYYSTIGKLPKVFLHIHKRIWQLVVVIGRLVVDQGTMEISKVNG
jgi:hypothetical protein